MRSSVCLPIVSGPAEDSVTCEVSVVKERSNDWWERIVWQTFSNWSRKRIPPCETLFQLSSE